MFDTNFGFESMKATLLVTSQHHVFVLVLFLFCFFFKEKKQVLYYLVTFSFLFINIRNKLKGKVLFRFL